MSDYRSSNGIFIPPSNSDNGPYSLPELASLIERRNSSFPAHSRNDSRKVSHAQCHWVAIEIKRRQCPGVGWHLLSRTNKERYTFPRQFVEWFCDDRESRNKPPIVMARPMKLWSSLMSTGVGQVWQSPPCQGQFWCHLRRQHALRTKLLSLETDTKLASA